jgi:hypothetical protein
MIPYEDISNVDQNKAIASATDVLKAGWSRRNYPRISVSDPIPWALSNQDERSWNFYIHCWDMLDCLLKAHSATHDCQYLLPAIKVAEDWADRHSDPSAPTLSPLAWYDMAVGLRAYRLAYIIDAGIRGTSINDAQRGKLWASLEQHQSYLAEDSNIQFHNNHGYYQVVGQLAMGRRFAAGSPVMAQAMDQGRRRLKAMLAQQFGKDGIHREHSPDYHRMVYDTLKAMIDSGLVNDVETIEFAQTIETALSSFVLPNQHIANFGDSDYRSMQVSPAEACRKWRTEEMRCVATGGKIGMASPTQVNTFSEGGYVVVRRPSRDKPDDFSQMSYLAQTACFHSRAHKQADDLAFIWSEKGSDLLVDAGRYGYLGKTEEGSELWFDGHWYSDPNRVYCESTRAHNTLEFDEKNYPRKGVKPYGSAVRRVTVDVSGLVAMETECRHFRSIRRARVLALMPGSWLLVFDWFHDNSQQPHDVKQWFHLAPELQLQVHEGSYIASVSGSTEPLKAISLLPGPLASRPFLGEEKPVMQGWWSPKEREIVPNYAFCYELTGMSNGAFATLFSFSQKLEADLDWNRANVSGRKARFRWATESGRHELRFERPETGNFALSYIGR